MKARKHVHWRRQPKATTSDVLNHSAFLVPFRHKAAYRELLRLRESLLNDQIDLAKDAKEEQPSFSRHMADAGTDSFDRDLALSLLSSQHEALYEIEEALDRIRNGTYGICEVTGKPIEKERLKVEPWTRFSVAAKRQLERERNMESDRRRLAELRKLPRESVAEIEPTA